MKNKCVLGKCSQVYRCRRLAKQLRKFGVNSNLHTLAHKQLQQLKANEMPNKKCKKHRKPTVYLCINKFMDSNKLTYKCT